jgi:hypothetical protein
MLDGIARITDARTGRCSSWDTTGRNADAWRLEPGQTRVLADIEGPGQITHIWMTQGSHYRECLLKITWDGARGPSVLVPLGDFFGLGHGLVRSYQSALFTASTSRNYRFNAGCALNCYVPMPFRRRAVVELVNESKEPHGQYFYIDYETFAHEPDADQGYFHAEFRRNNPFVGWEGQVRREGRQVSNGNVVNKEQQAWDNNYVILETKGRGHYIGCNLSITNLHKGWWGEGDDMIWVDGYKWPPDLHGTGSEDYFNQAWGMQDNAFLRNGSSIFEGGTTLSYSADPWAEGAYQTSYIYHLENPVRFQRQIKVTIEHGHGNNLDNEVSSVAYWYADRPGRAVKPPPVARRMPVLRDNQGRWLHDPRHQCPGRPVDLTDEMRQ